MPAIPCASGTCISRRNKLAVNHRPEYLFDVAALYINGAPLLKETMPSRQVQIGSFLSSLKDTMASAYLLIHEVAR